MCACVCVRACVHVQVNLQALVCLSMLAHVNICACEYIIGESLMDINVFLVRMRARAYACMFWCVHLHLNVCINMYTYTIYISPNDVIPQKSCLSSIWDMLSAKFVIARIS